MEVAVVKDKLYAIAGRNCAICPELDINEEYTPFGYGTPDPSYDGEPEPFPTAVVVTVSGALLAIAAVGLMVYWKKRKRGVVQE